MGMDEEAPAFQVEQHVTAYGFASWFGIGEIVAIRQGEALVKWDNDKYRHSSWVKFEELTDVEYKMR